MTSNHALVLDALVCICLTLLLALHAIPPEAGLTMLGGFVGARAVMRIGGGGGRSGGASGGDEPRDGKGGGLMRRALVLAQASAAIAMFLALWSLVAQHLHPHAEHV
jgi:hypothetical protein